MSEHDDIRAIEQLKYRYLRSGDTRDWELQRACLADDFEGVWGQGFSFSGADKFIESTRAMMDNTRLVVHTAGHPEIEVRGDEASGIWLMSWRAVRKATGVLVDGAGHYHDEYRRTPDGNWVISRLRLDVLYEVEVTLAEPSSFALTFDHLAG